MDNKIWEFLAISNFEGGGEPKPPNIQELNITQNGTYEAMDGVDGYNPVTVNVSGGEPEPPADGKTRLYITVPANSMPGLPPPRNEVPLYIKQSVANGVTIDWGDGSAQETLPGTGNVNTTHTYQTAGDFVISLDPAEGCELRFEYDSSSYCVMGPTNINGMVYCNMLHRAVLGSRGVTSIGGNAFSSCHSLASVTIPDGVTSIGYGAFNKCYSLASVTIPDGVTSIGDNVFYYCYSLASVTIPDGVTSIGGNAFCSCYSLGSVTIPDSATSIGGRAFRSCYSLASVTIPDSITNIGDYAFDSCYGVKEYHILSVTPPSLSKINAFSGISSDCIIYVPAGSLEAYQTATNWSEYADQMQEEPA